MSLDETEVTQANGKLHHLFPRPEVDDAPPQAPDQDEQPNLDYNVNEVAAPKGREPRRRIRVRDVATHRHTKTALRHGAYVVAGGKTAVRRTWESRTTATHQRWIRAAQATGDSELAAKWAAEAERVREARHKRRLALLHAPVIAAKSLVYGAAGLFGLGIVLTVTGDHASPLMPLADVSHAIEFVFRTASRAWDDTRYLLPFVLTGALWAIGRKSGDAPAWLATSADGEDLVMDERTITLALQALRIKPITDHLKKGNPLQYLTPAREDGRGTYASIRLPSGVSAEKVIKRRTDLASGLHRAAKEVFPTIGKEAGILDLWIADKGRLEEGAGPYPLLDDGKADFFKGFPLGRTLRGDLRVAPVNGRNTIVGGMPGQGKSSAARALMAGASLDPTCELRIWVPDANFDFEGFKRRCSKYVMGAEDELIELIREDCELLHEEIQARGRLLIDYEEPEVTRVLADRDHRLRPLMTLLEEAHVAFNHPVHGKDISKLTVENVRLGRKRAVHQIVSTQAPTKDSIPRDVTRNCSNGLAFAVGDFVANDALLGQGAYRGGHRATELIPGTDRGVCLAKGLSGERSELLQVHFISITRDLDELTPLMDRAVEAANERGGRVSGAARPAERRDLLADVAEVLGGERIGAADVARLLMRLAPRYPGYSGLTGTALVARLAEVGVKVPSTANKWLIDPETVRRALAARPGNDD
jgi:S-DNA-T family DNA segregation ATPase FtsK/SpoIIIE